MMVLHHRPDCPWMAARRLLGDKLVLPTYLETALRNFKAMGWTSSPPCSKKALETLIQYGFVTQSKSKGRVSAGQYGLTKLGREFVK